MTKEDCKNANHDWRVGAGFVDKDIINNVEEGIFVFCKYCNVKRQARFNKPIKEKRRKGK